MTKHLFRIFSAVMTTLLALLLLWQFRIVVIYVLISLIVAAVVRPLVICLGNKQLLRRLGWFLLFITGLVFFGLLFYFSGKQASTEFQILAQNVSEKDSWTFPIWLEGSAFQQLLIERLPPPSILFEAVSGEEGQLVLPALLGFVKGIGGVVSGILIIGFLSIYWVINQIHFERLWLSLLPPGQRKQARGIWRVIEPDIGGYIRGQLLQSLIIGVLLGLGYWLIGSPYPVLLALVGALACLIPVVGAVIAVIPPILVGLLTSVQLSLITVLFTLVILTVIIIWVKPRLFNRRWDNPILTVVILIALADAFGIVGIIIAPPISAVCQIIWNRLVSHRAVIDASSQLSDLKDRQEHIWETISAMDEPPPPLVTSSMEQLAQLIMKADTILHEDVPTDTNLPALPINQQQNKEK